jgi:hypothetical protein
MSEELRPHIWSMGNIICFRMSNFDEAYQIAQQLFRYDPQTIKRDARNETGQPIVETDRGQYLQIANDIQHLNHRECIIRRFRSEKEQEKYVLWVKRTKELPQNTPKISVPELKEMLLKERGVPVRQALEVIKARIEESKPNGKKQSGSEERPGT